MHDLNQVHFEIDWPSGRPFQVVALGLNAVDTICVLPSYPEHGGKLHIERRHRLGGGQIATAAALCGRFGLKTRYIGRVGDDENGVFSLEDLRKEPMDLTYVDVVAGAYSQFAIILVDLPTGERTVLWDRDPRLLYGPGELRREAVVEGQLLHVDGHDIGASVQAATWAREAGMKVSLDIDKVQPGVEDLLRTTDFAIPTLDFVREWSPDGDWRRGLAALGELVPGYAMVTRGKKGAALLWEGEIFSIPGFPVEAVDTTGAGDVFHGAFIYALFQNMTVMGCVRFANAAAVLACTRYGARASIPTLQDVEAHLAGSELELPTRLS